MLSAVKSQEKHKEKNMSITTNRVWKLSKRTFRKTTNEMHHLYNNRGIYWISLTFESIDDLSERRRINLKTDNKEEAIRLRDKILNDLKGRWIKL